MSSDKAPTLVYKPSRRRLLLALVMYVIFLIAVLLITFLIGRSWLGAPLRILCTLLMACVDIFTTAFCAFILYRMARSSPSIIIREDGIVDNGSLIYRGVGLLRWQEIAMIAAQDYRTDAVYGLWHRQFLVIVPTNVHEYESSLPQWMRLQRILLRFIIRSPGQCICIPRFMLPKDAKFIRMDIGTAYFQWYPAVGHSRRSVQFM